jgi:Cdc6-like AAA superfamily ATPase
VDDDTKYKFFALINEAFTPEAPINSRELFAGRARERDRVTNTIFRRGAHTVLFGERGVGKTSLANTIFDFLVAVLGEANYAIARVTCSAAMNFEAIWRTLFSELTVEYEGKDLSLDSWLGTDPHAENIRQTIAVLSNPSILVIDEYDRITDPITKKALADTIKTLSDNSVNTTLIIVGVADSIDELIADHASIDRAIVQVRMPRMSKKELLEIVDKGVSKCQITFEPDVRQRLADYSQGLPSYTHLLARESALSAIRDGRTHITLEDLKNAIKESVDNQLGTHLTAYMDAVSAPRGKYFKPLLLACALAKKDEKGFFYATNVTDPFRAITGKDFNIPAFARTLRLFSGKRGPILEQVGRKYRFRKPLMEPFVILRGLADGLIQEDQLTRPSATSNEPEQLALLSFSAVQESEQRP